MEDFARHAVQVLEHYGFDGLDLDWEYPGYDGDTNDKAGKFLIFLRVRTVNHIYIIKLDYLAIFKVFEDTI